MKRISLALLIPVCLSLVSCMQESNKQYLSPEEQVVVVGDSSDVEVSKPDVDILFVVDNSGSMGSHQARLSQNIQLFTSQFTKNASLNYHIGVTTTDMDPPSSWNAGGERGKLIGNPKFVTPQTIGGETKLAKNILIGSDGSGTELSFAPVLAALTPPLVDADNVGFLRPDAHLVIVFITDAEDQSLYKEDVFYQRLLPIKGGDATKILAYGVLAMTSDISCVADGARPTQIEKFLTRFSKNKSNVMSLCSSTYGKQLASMGTDIARRVTSTVYLKRLPVLETLRVYIGNIELSTDPKKGWTYDPRRNAVVLGSNLDWSMIPAGAQVRVSYRAIENK